MGKKLYANFLTGTLCGVEDWHKFRLSGEKTLKKSNKKETKKKQAEMVLPVPESPKMSLGNNNNCPLLNVYHVVPQIERIDS